MAKTHVSKILDYCYKAADLSGSQITLADGISGGARRHGYVYGGQGELYTEEMARDWAKRGRSIPPGRKDTETKEHYFTVSCALWFGRIVEDCSGMIINAIRTGQPGYKDTNAANLIDGCTKTGNIKTLPEVPGLCVWKSGHIGLYIGGGWVIEARGTAYGVVKSRLDTQKWKKWGYLAGVDYGSQKEATKTESKGWVVSRLLKLTSPMQDGADVKELQERILDYGIKRVVIGGGSKTLKADGIFGPITDAAVKAYQKSKGLDVDGKAGKHTITALGGVWRG